MDSDTLVLGKINCLLFIGVIGVVDTCEENLVHTRILFLMGFCVFCRLRVERDSFGFLDTDTLVLGEINFEFVYGVVVSWEG